MPSNLDKRGAFMALGASRQRVAPEGPSSGAHVHPRAAPSPSRAVRHAPDLMAAPEHVDVADHVGTDRGQLTDGDRVAWTQVVPATDRHLIRNRLPRPSVVVR